MDMYRGHKIHKGKNGEWMFYDTNDLITAWLKRPCGYCDAADTPEGYDGCLGYLPGVRNACCGHGEWATAYIQFTKGLTIRGIVAHCFGYGLNKITKLNNYLKKVKKGK